MIDRKKNMRYIFFIVMVCICILVLSKYNFFSGLVEANLFSNYDKNKCVYTINESINTDEELKKNVMKMHTFINEERRKNGLKLLNLDSKLTTVAQMKAQDMVNKNYLSHVSPTYGTIYNMLKNNGIKYFNAGENIGSVYNIESAHTSFMNSPMHKNAILYPKFDKLGIGIAQMPNKMHKISIIFISSIN